MTIDYQPGKAGDAELRSSGDQTTLVFVRLFRHPPDKVWLALTDPAHLREWAPFDPDRDMSSTGAVNLSLVGAPDQESAASQILVADRPRILEYRWGKDDLLRWELEAIETGTRLTLYHTVQDRTVIPKAAAGWHICLDIAERALDGSPIGRIPPEDSKKFGWERLNAEYAERFGIENTGWPGDLDPDRA